MRDEEVRFIKNVDSLLSALEKREEDVVKEGSDLTQGKLKEFVERVWRFKELTGFTDPRCPEGLEVLKKAGLYLCETCKEFHPTLMKCPFLSIRKEGSNPVSGGEEHGN